MPLERASAIRVRDGGCGRRRRRRRPSSPWSRATTSCGRQPQMLVRASRAARLASSAGVGLAEQRCDLVGVRAPAGLLGGDLGLVAGLGRGDQIGGDEDVLRSSPVSAFAGGLAVERLDRVADVGLVLQQPADRRLGVRATRREADDREPRPRDVVFPELCASRCGARIPSASSPRSRGAARAVGVSGLTVRDGEGGERAEERDQRREAERDRVESCMWFHVERSFRSGKREQERRTAARESRLQSRRSGRPARPPW